MNMRIIYSRAFIKSAKNSLADKEKVGSVIGRNSGKSVCTESSHKTACRETSGTLFSKNHSRLARGFYFKSKENIVLVDTSHRSDIYK